MFENQQSGMAGFNPLANMKPGYYRPGPAPMPEPWPGPYGRDVGDWWVPVSSLKDAENAFVQPGQTKWFMVQNKMQFAVKSVSGAGVMDFQAFDFAPHIEAQPVQQDAGTVSVPVAALDEILNKVQSVVDRVAKIEDVVGEAKEAKDNGKPVKQVSGNAGRANAGAAK